MPQSRAATAVRHNDGDATRRNILDVALKEFADKGLDGARVDEIAEKTASSKRMIYYYFGGKDELYRAVLERAYAGIREREEEENFEALPADEALKAHMAHTFDYHAAHPEFVRLVMNENIHRGAHIAHIPGIKERNRRVVALMAAIIDKGVMARLFRDGIDPFDLHMTISALCFYNVSNRYTLSMVFEADIGAKQALERRKASVIATVLASVMRQK